MLRKLIVVLGCIHLLGGSFGMLQIVAWANMLVSYSQNVGIKEGITKTFDGAHPCSLCVAIKEAKDHEREKQPLQMASDKLSLKELTLPLSLALKPPVASPAPHISLPEPVDTIAARSDAPPLPPPRHLA